MVLQLKCSTKGKKWLGTDDSRSGRNGALLNGWNTIEPRGEFLQDAMPMQCRTLFRAHDIVAHVNGDGITPISFDQWARECSVNEKSTFVHSIGSNETSGDVEVVCGAAACRKDQHESGLVRGIVSYRRQGLQCRDWYLQRYLIPRR